MRTGCPRATLTKSDDERSRLLSIARSSSMPAALTLPTKRDRQEFRVRSGGCTLRRHGFDEAFAEHDCELGLGDGPLTWRHFPSFLGSVQDQVKQLGGGLVVGEVAPGPDSAPELRVQCLD